LASKTEGGTLLAVGALFGASSFSLNIILSTIILSAGGLITNLERGNFKRDLSTFLIAVIVATLLGLMYESFLVIGVVLVALYFIFIAVCIYQETRADQSVYREFKEQGEEAEYLEELARKKKDKENGVEQ
jgi:Ca2+/Na+ antiporter